jgi:predicted  nucleic acid-binding Zn-ribbon protein
MMQDLKEIRRTLNVMTLQLDTTEMKLNESNIRLQEIQAKSTDIYATGEDTNNRVREGQAWMERQERSRAQIEDLAELRKTLNAKDIIKASDAISRVTALLRRLSEDQTHGRKNAAQMSPAMLKANKSFRDWNERSESSMLVLGGHNFVRKTDSEPDCKEEMS